MIPKISATMTNVIGVKSRNVTYDRIMEEGIPVPRESIMSHATPGVFIGMIIWNGSLYEIWETNTETVIYDVTNECINDDW